MGAAISLAGFVALLASGAAHAQERDEPIRLEYAAAPSCPSEASFLTALRSRSPRIRVAAPTERARHVVIRLAARPPRFEGRLVLRAEDGSESARTIAGDTCNEVATALALITAVAIDPLASTAPNPPPPPAVTAPPSAPTASASTAPPPAPSSAPPPPSSKPAPEARPPASTASREAAEQPSPALPPAIERPGWHGSIGAQATLVGGVSATARIGGAVLFDLTRTSADWFSPSFRARVERTAAESVDVAPGTASFTWTAGSLEMCPVAWPRARVRISPCARVEAGLLESQSSNIAPTRSDSALWLAADAVARARWAIAGPIVLELEGAIRFPIVRDHFYFEPSRTVFDVPVVAWSGAAGLTVTIW